MAVAEGRDIAAIANKLLDLPFVIKIATKDWHPQDHVSFASNHPGKKPYLDFATVINPSNPAETYETRVWPDHCVQNTKGAEIIHELHMEKIDKVVEKGQRKEVEMYSAFYDPLEHPRISDSGLAGVLKERGVTDVFVIGLTFDFCVKSTAIDAVKEGFKTYIISEATRAADASAWKAVETEVRSKGVELISLHGAELERVGKI